MIDSAHAPPSFDPPPFEPPPFLRNPHAQTVAGCFLQDTSRYPLRPKRRGVPLPDGDMVVIHDDQPDDWNPGDRVVLLIHGLGGSHRSAYLIRIAAKLHQHGYRTFRMDFRGCGAAVGLAAKPFHCGLSDDVAAAIRKIHHCCLNSPISLIGFSMGGMTILKLLGEDRDDLAAEVDSAFSISPPIDIVRCGLSIREHPNYFYDRYFTKMLLDFAKQHRPFCQLAKRVIRQSPRRVWDFDELYTARKWGYESAEDFYQATSAIQHLHRIEVPTQIVTSRDDPLVPFDMFERAELSPSIGLHVTERGGHLGFIGKRGVDPDRWWLDWRVVEWVSQLPRRFPETRPVEILTSTSLA
ncbi:putative hydrolase [Planctomycetes bacterium Pan216]|uniref:Putative hydrolase n=1 Tax=Kolteria novifilia TaxID=2527975 RepID=A0A518BBE1_9BACT|nr:putative hydrolase [Planctomycetes bacterium Pan216]